MHRLDGNELREGFLRFFEARGHTRLASSSLVPTHPAAPIFTNAGMVPFFPYWLGEEAPPHPRITTVQKCVRAGGKHNDLEEVGRTNRHLSFFEMLGNFSFGDYFKAEAIPTAWEMVTELFGIDPELLWVTVYEDDEEAAGIWRDVVGVRPERIQRFGEADNFWQVGEVGLCGPSSEIFFDKGDRFGPGGGPAADEDRYVEIWNLVFMQYDKQPDGSLVELPAKNIDTGAGLERILAVLQDRTTVFETDVLLPLVERAGALAARRYGDDERADVSLRILADHARASSFLIADGVFPSNEERGYVLRRIIRRAVRHAYLLGLDRPIMPSMVDTTVDLLGDAYPELRRDRDFVVEVIGREEHRFQQTLRTGSALLDEELGHLGEGAALSGSVAFKLHDTYGFPLEVTQEIAAERGVDVDVDGFDAAMAEQRRRAREAQRGGVADSAAVERYREVVDRAGPTEFVGYTQVEATARIVAIHGDEVFLDRTPFYAEAGGQVGDTGTLVTETGTARVLDTQPVLAGLYAHRVEITRGELHVDQDVVARVDVPRREAIMRNHTGTHMVHWALREVLGDHVRQQGSLVGPDYLRFDFSHFEAARREELRAVEEQSTREILADHRVRAFETDRRTADEMGAIAMFNEKYGDRVRIVEAGPSRELCGGTHVAGVGEVGPVVITSEGSIAANQRRIVVLTGLAALGHLQEQQARLEQASQLLDVPRDDLVAGVTRRLDELEELREEVKSLRTQLSAAQAGELAEEAVDGVLVARRDGATPNDLRDLALALRDRPGVRAVVLGGVNDKGGASLVAAVTPDSGLDAGELLADAARAVKGGGSRRPDVSMAGGKDASRIDEALERARAAAGVG